MAPKKTVVSNLKKKKDKFSAKEKKPLKVAGVSVSVAQLLDKTVSLQNGCARTRTLFFLNLIKDGLELEKTLLIETKAFAEKCVIIDEIVSTLTDLIARLNSPEDPLQKECNILRQAIHELKKIDANFAYNKSQIYKSIKENSSLNMNSEIDDNILDTISLSDNDDASSSTHDEYFDKCVLTQALEAHVQTKPEPDSNICQPEFKMNKLSNFKTTNLKFHKNTLLCTMENTDKVIRYSFKGSTMNHIPARTKLTKFGESPIIDIIIHFDKYILFACKEGSIIKTTLKCKVKSKFALNEEIFCMTEYKGILYVSTLRKIHSVNHLALTNHRDALELAYSVKSLKVIIYHNLPVLLSLADTGCVIGYFIKSNNNSAVSLTGELAFKFDAVADFFDVRLAIDTTMFFFGNTYGVTRKDLVENKLYKYDLTSMSVSSMLVEKYFLFVGSTFGDLLIINTENNYIYQCRSVAHGKILSMLYIPSLLYIGSEDGLRCLYLDSVPGLE